ncbi:hypothetical protein [Streptomyces alboflavus]|uniref:hypothetical protein n=1 Tax=Streptomyces alboflavus TaxID=67267 RepID=UPI000F657FB0|nr:hypothetical protein [Streptomyces alboflavus]
MGERTFPDDLLRAQEAWFAVYRRLAASSAGTAVYRRQLQQLSVRIAAHPYWGRVGGGPAARRALREQALARVGGTSS